jgi:HAD superfamily hydrolase (TIGR01549 family)
MNPEITEFLKEFNSHFHQYKNIPIVLYGIGEKTNWILENLNEYNIIGLMDKDTTGKHIYGKKVLSSDEVIKQAKAIIIVANMASNKIIYQRIRHLFDLHDIPILFTDGTKPVIEDNQEADNPYLANSHMLLKERIDKAEAVSFDLFDTLIMRKTILPSDVFDIMENNMSTILGKEIQFKVPRIAAEKYCYSLDSNYDIHNIYRRLEKTLDLSAEDAKKLKNAEIETEISISLPRIKIAELYRYAVSQGKKVCITTDTYLDHNSITAIISSCGIPNPQNLFISCEMKRSKLSGTMWEYIKEHYKTNNMLHIGDNEIGDFEMPQRHGVSPFLVKNGYDLMTLSLGSLLERAENRDDRLALGLIAARFFNDPFTICSTKGRLSVNTMFDIGYLCFGPLIYSFIRWLIEKVQAIDSGRVLFFARDGYLLKELYDMTARDLGITVPEGIYFYTSRRSSSLITIRKKEDISFIIKAMCRYRKNTLRELLYRAFGVEGDKEDTNLDLCCFEWEDDQIITYLIETYGNTILSHAEEERIRYLNYVDSLHLQNAANLFCVNFVGRGATQFFISKLLGREITGFYFALESFQKESYFIDIPARGLYDSYSGDITRSFLLKHFLFGEVVLSSPDEQFIRFDADGKPIFDNLGKNRNFSIIDKCHAGIREYFNDASAIHYGLSGHMTMNLVDELYGLFLTDRCVISDQVRNSFIFKDYYDASSQDGCILEI